MSSERTTLIARNTLMLYIRMVVMMAVMIYAQRVVFRALGVVDYGIYDVVGGVTALFWFLNTAMAHSTQRFLNYEMGAAGGGEGVARVFSMSVKIHAGIALVVAAAGETVGLWLVNSVLNIPPERMGAANAVFQFTIFTSCLNIVRVPWNALIIAHEKMSFYGLLSIVEALLTLGMVMLLAGWGGDRLILYAALMFAVVGAVNLCYVWYCRRAFPAVRYRRVRDRALLRRMVGFSGWTMLGSGAGAGAQKGTDILLNMFFGVAISSSMGLAGKVSSAVYGFVMNFQTAFSPQIVKSHAAGDRDYFLYLIFRASKYSWFMLLLIALPVVLYAHTVLELWLGAGEVPAHTAAFVRLILLYVLVDALSGPLGVSVFATGRIRGHQIMMCSLMVLNLPLIWLALRGGLAPESALVIRIGINVVTVSARLAWMRRHMQFPAWRYVRRVVLTVSAVTAVAVPLPALVAWHTSGLWGLALTVAVSCVSVGVSAFVLGMNRTERAFFTSRIKRRKI